MNIRQSKVVDILGEAQLTVFKELNGSTCGSPNLKATFARRLALA
jgi:hypothetical protein